MNRNRRFPGLWILPLLLIVPAATVSAQVLEQAEYGPAIVNTLFAPAGNMTFKGVIVKLGGAHAKAAVCYDTDLMRLSVGWVGAGENWPGLIDPRSSTSFTASHGGPPAMKGTLRLQTAVEPGWSKGTELKDPRKPQNYPGGMKIGPLPADWATYKGMYKNGDQVVLAYSVGGVDVMETPGIEGDIASQSPIFTRTIRLGATTQPMTIYVSGMPGHDKTSIVKMGEWEVGEAKTGPAEGSVALEDSPPDGAAVRMAVAVAKGPAGATWKLDSGRLYLNLPANAQPATFKLVMWNGTREDLPKFKEAFEAASQKVVDPETLTHGGALQWGAALETKGKIGTGDEAYVADTISTPDSNPFHSLLRFGGFDYFSDGRAALSTISGDVWIVSGIDDKLDNLKWKRFATGLFQPLGLKIVDDKVYTICRDGIIRLSDLNNDGEADFYEAFNHDALVTDNYHEFCFDLQTDSKGDFYYTKGAPWSPDVKSDQQGCAIKVSKDGKKLEVIATGLRAPNGSSMGPHDEYTCSDNQGHWMPSSKVNRILPGKFYGMMQTAHMNPAPTDYEKPFLWLPMNMDNSSGGQAWATGDKWGPLNGHLIHMSYGTSSLFNVMHESVDDTWQAAAVKFPLAFDSSCMRARFNPKDGQLYIAGLKGWQTNAKTEGAFHRVRFTNKPVRMPVDFHVAKNGIFITFATPLDAKSAADDGNWSIEQWNYKWTGNYGSPEFSIADPNKPQHDEVDVKAAKVSSDGKTVWLQVDKLQPVMQMKIKCNIKDAAGKDLSWEIYNTINKVGPERNLQ